MARLIDAARCSVGAHLRVRPVSNTRVVAQRTLAGVGYRRRIRLWRQCGYHVSLFFLSLPDVDTAIARVAARVRQGGHDIPEDVIRRRFAAGLRDFEAMYKAEVDTWALYDNAGDEPVLLDWSQRP